MPRRATCSHSATGRCGRWPTWEGQVTFAESNRRAGIESWPQASTSGQQGFNMDAQPHRVFKYYDFVMAAYVCVLLCANLIGPAKVSTAHGPIIGNVTFLAGVLFFP